MQQSKRKIIKTRAGELGHLDSHYLSRDTIVGTKHRYYLVGLIDAYTRLAWAEVVGDIKSLSVMFAVLKSINFLNAEYGIQFEAILTDNGPEMASPRNTEGHPMERMLNELGIKHRYTRPYRPQTNGKIERFWRTLNEDLLEGTTFESVSELKDELQQYLSTTILRDPTRQWTERPLWRPFNPSNSVNESSDIYRNDRVNEIRGIDGLSGPVL